MWQDAGNYQIKKNLDIVLEIKKHFTDFEWIVSDAKSKNTVIPEDENG